MSEHHAQHGAHGAGHDEHAGHHPNYKKIYFTLLILLVISVAGPFFGHVVVTLITAFGIALVLQVACFALYLANGKLFRRATS